MKIRSVFAAVLMLFGVALAAAAICLCVLFWNHKPILVGETDNVQQQAASFMDSVCEADFEQASDMILGKPALGVDRDANSDVGNLIWDAYWDSTQYQLIGECYATENGVAQNISFTYLDVTQITGKLRERSLSLLEERVASAKDTSEIYDENNEYREDVVLAVLYEAATQILEENTECVTVELVVNLRYENGRWWIVPDDELIDAIFCGCLF